MKPVHSYKQQNLVWPIQASLLLIITTIRINLTPCLFYVSREGMANNNGRADFDQSEPVNKYFIQLAIYLEREMILFKIQWTLLFFIQKDKSSIEFGESKSRPVGNFWHHLLSKVFFSLHLCLYLSGHQEGRKNLQFPFTGRWTSPATVQHSKRRKTLKTMVRILFASSGSFRHWFRVNEWCYIRLTRYLG